MSALRVAQCYTGSVGRRIINLISARHDLELVGVLVHNSDKDSVDAGVLAGSAPIGVSATTSLDAIIDLDPDCAIWMGKGWQPDQLCTLLRAGINVYAPVGALYLPGDPQFAAMQQACLAGGSTLVGGGSIPGLVSDVLPLFLTGYIGRVDRIRAAQSNLVWDYQSADRLSAGLGLGAALSAAPTRMPSAVDRKWIRYITQSAAMIADAIGLDFGGLELTSKDYAPAPHDLQLPSGLSIAAGTAAGVRWIFTGYSAAGDQFYTLTKEQVAVCGLGPTWRQSGDAPQWRVEIDGCPSLVCDLSTVSRDGFGQATADLNAARAVNLVASIVAAAPGCRSVRDFAAPTGTALGRRLSG